MTCYKRNNNAKPYLFYLKKRNESKDNLAQIIAKIPCTVTNYQNKIITPCSPESTWAQNTKFRKLLSASLATALLKAARESYIVKNVS